MAKFGVEQADQYINQNGLFFGLQNDGDIAYVRFMYADEYDLEGYMVHKKDPDNIKSGYIECIRTADDTKDVCPLCAAENRAIVRTFIKLIQIENEETGEEPVKIWDRGKVYFRRLQNLCKQYNPLHNQIFTITRQGDQGDLETKYVVEPYSGPLTSSFLPAINLEDYEMPEIYKSEGNENGMVEVRDYAELEYLVTNGHFEGEASKVTARSAPAENATYRRDRSSRVDSSSNTSNRRNRF